jgi:hypothetical protein
VDASPHTDRAALHRPRLHRLTRVRATTWMLIAVLPGLSP